MKKLLLLITFTLLGISAYSQTNEVYNLNPIQGELARSKSHLEDYEIYSKYSTYCQYGALGSMAASIGCFVGYATLDQRYNYKFDNKGNVTEKELRTPARNYIMSGVCFAAISLICEAVAINYKFKAAKSLKLYATGNGASITLNF